MSRIRELRGRKPEHIEDVFSRVFLNQIFVLIESAEMVLERAGVGTNFVKIAKIGRFDQSWVEGSNTIGI